MRKYEFPNAKNVVVCGDIHGDFKDLIFRCWILYEMTDTLIVVAGDCGFGFEKPDYYKDIFNDLAFRLELSNLWVVFIRGNHDNPAYFNGIQVNYKRWKAIPDYSVLEACGHTILCVGGAISVDRDWRMTSEKHHTCPKDLLQPDVYWPKEAPVFDKDNLDALNHKHAIDTVISHSAPSFCELSSKTNLEDWFKVDPLLPKDLQRERETMDNVLKYLKANGHPLKYWYYGHFHQSWNRVIEGVKYNMLNCMEFKKL